LAPLASPDRRAVEQKYEEIITVRPEAEMDDETFHKHLEYRHLPENDWAGLTSLRGGQQFSNQRKVYSTWHEYCHKEWPGSYDHEH
jgi:hypothetical protein